MQIVLSLLHFFRVVGVHCEKRVRQTLKDLLQLSCSEVQRQKLNLPGRVRQRRRQNRCLKKRGFARGGRSVQGVMSILKEIQNQRILILVFGVVDKADRDGKAAVAGLPHPVGERLAPGQQGTEKNLPR